MVEFHDRIGVRFIDLANELEELIGIGIDMVSKRGAKARYFQYIEEDLI